MVQRLRLCPSNVGGMGSILGWGIKIPHTLQGGLKKKNKTNSQFVLLYTRCNSANPHYQYQGIGWKASGNQFYL